LQGQRLPAAAPGAQAQPDQVERTQPFERGEQLSAGHDQGRHAQRAGQHMKKTPQSRAQTGGHAFGPATRQRARRHIKDARARGERQYQGSRQKHKEGAGITIMEAPWAGLAAQRGSGGGAGSYTGLPQPMHRPLTSSTMHTPTQG
jgi:hypothetical protein